MPKKYQFSDLSMESLIELLHNLNIPMEYIFNQGDTKSIALDLELTQDCNFQCKYCIERGYFKPNHMQEHIMEEVIKKSDYILNKTDYANNITFGLWGGEPTLNRKNIELLCNHYMNDNRVSFHLFTNSILLESYYDLIHKVNEIIPLKFITQISYDGYAIHNSNRVDRCGRVTGTIVRANILKAAKNNIPFNLKSTIPYRDLDKVYESYLDICDIADECNQYNTWNDIQYAPTLDYSLITYNTLNDKNIEEYLKIFEDQLLKIAEHEYERYKNGKSLVFTWFDAFNKPGRLRRATCAAGDHYKCINYSGTVLTCHGCMFSPNSDKHFITHAFEDDKTFVKKLRVHDNVYCTLYKNDRDSVEPYECINCDASICYVCNSLKYELSNKDCYIHKWWDSTSQPYLCRFYKVASNIYAALKLKYDIHRGG